jgi:aspartyl/asparaginyl-tRNA synthetase
MQKIYEQNHAISLTWALQNPIFAQKENLSSLLLSNEHLEKLKTTEHRCKLFSTPEMQALARMEAALLRGARKYFDANNFTEIIVPHLTRATSACENITTMFKVDHFGENCYC